MKFKFVLFCFISFMLSCYTPEEYQDWLISLTEETLHDDTYGYVDISADCNCLDQEYYWMCYDSYYLFEDEYKRILEIIDQAINPCIYVQGEDVEGKRFVGFVLNYGRY